MRFIHWTSLLFLSLFLFKEGIAQKTPALHLGQGILVGEVTTESAILQTRLTKSHTLVNGHLPGASGWVRFAIIGDEPGESTLIKTPWMQALANNDFLVKQKVSGLSPALKHHYWAEYGIDTLNYRSSLKGSFTTNAGAEIEAPMSFVVVTGMNYYFFHYGNYRARNQYKGLDKHLGFPALKAILDQKPDYFIGTGDNVYFDHPAKRGFQRALERGDNPLPGLFGGEAVTTEAGMRRKYHVQFVQPRFRDLFSQVATYWEKDDHDYRVNDSDPYTDFPISHELGIKNFREQLPVVDPNDPVAVTYRTHRLSKDVQIWLLEGRDYRSANRMEDGPEKTIWGKEQKSWLKETLLASNAKFKFIISPTPMVGPDDASKRDNHVNLQGFRTEGDEFFDWLTKNDFLNKGLYFLCGDRHWQYHAVHPSGFEEFSSGALVEANSRAGRVAGDPKSTDPEGNIKQLYIQGKPEQATAGFLHVSVSRSGMAPVATFSFYDEFGTLLYQVSKK